MKLTFSGHKHFVSSSYAVIEISLSICGQLQNKGVDYYDCLFVETCQVAGDISKINVTLTGWQYSLLLGIATHNLKQPPSQPLSPDTSKAPQPGINTHQFNLSTVSLISVQGLMLNCRNVFMIYLCVSRNSLCN